MKTSFFHPCILIPVYNHEHAIGSVLARILEHGTMCLLVDDGSSPACAQELDRLATAYPEKVIMLRHPSNQGKGAAILTGIRHAALHGYSHVLQIDADGQHNTDDIPLFLAQAHKYPNAIICGYPIYDESVPKIRLYGRYLTHIWVWINTLSLKIKDSMCGFRVYPTLQVTHLAAHQPLQKRMAFDTDILVRLCWNGIEIINLPTRVSYPVDGISHFRLWADNFHISYMHTRLFFGMLLRLPLRLWRK